MKQKIVSRLLSLVLATTLVISNASITSFATEVNEEQSQIEVEESDEISTTSTGTDVDEITTFSTKESTLAPGITQTINSGYAADGKLINYYVAIADINREDVGIHTTYKDAQCTTAGMAKMTEQAVSMEKLHSNSEDADNYIPYYAVVAGVNGDGYNTGSGKPSGAHVMNGVSGFGISKSGNSPWFAIFEDGTALCGSNDTDWDEAVAAHGDAMEAIGGFQLVRKNGVDISYGSAEAGSSYLDDGRYPRSFVGVTSDNKVVFMAVDGNGAGSSVGSDYAESLELMKEQDCTYILCLDGGGSATYISRPEGSDDIEVTNIPSDGSERAVSNGLIMYTTTPPSDVFSHATITVENSYITPNSKVNVSAIGVSPAGTAAEIPEDAVWAATNGAVENGVFISDGTLGDAVISLLVNGESVGSTIIHVVLPDAIEFTRSSITVPLGATIELDVVASYGLYTVLLNENDITFTLDDENAGTISGTKFTAAESGTGTQVTAIVNGTNPVVSATMEIKLGKGSEILFDFEEDTISADLDNWRLGDHSSGKHIFTELSIVTEETGKVHSGDQALAFNYHMDQAIHGTEFWAGNSLIWTGESIEVKNATSIGFWLYVPEDAVHLALWFSTATHDEEGNMNGWTGYEPIEYTDTKYENPEYSGWHYVTIPITQDAVYIEDNADQIGKTFNGSQFKYKANCLIKFYAVNIDSWKTNDTNYAGDFTFYIDDFTVDYSEAVEDREEPIFSGMTYAVEGMSDAATLNGQTVNEKVVNFAALVAEDTTNEDNASGLDTSSAVAYIDGVKVNCEYSDGKITVSDAVLTDGVHTIRMGISDKIGNYAESKRQITVKSSENDASVRVRPQDSTLNYILNDAVYWIDVEADDIENVKSVEAKLDLDSMNNWVLDQIKVLHGFDCEYSFVTAAEKAENILTIKFTRNDDYLSEKGTTVLASIPIRVWEYVSSDDHKHANAVEAWNCNYVCAPALSIDVDTEMGIVTYLDETSHTFSSEDIHTLGVSYTYGLRMRDYDNEYYSSHSYHVHTEKAIADLSATCTEDGYSDRTYCETCESVVTWGITEKATGHEFSISEDILKCSCGQTFTGLWTDGREYVDGTLVADGWVNDSYWLDGKKLTGVQLVDGYYYDFGEDGVCDGQTKYTGIFYDETVSAWRYAKIGELYGGWAQVDENWHYFWKYNYQAATGEVTLDANGVTYQFDERGMTKGAWHTTEEGTRYYYSDDFYRARQEGYQAFFEIDGKTYNFNESGYVTYGQYRALQPGAFIMQREVFEFNEDGSLIGKYTEPGPILCADGYLYLIHEDGIAYMDCGLVEYDGAYYDVKWSGKLAMNEYRDITTENSNGLDVEPGKYYFGEDGKMVIPEASFTGIKQAEDGYTYYYVDSVVYKGHPGLIELDGAYYDVKWSGKIAMNEYRDITVESSNGLDVEPGKYYFGEDGKMVIPEALFTGIKQAEDGYTYYYVDSVIYKGHPGLIELDGAYYDVKWSGKIAMNEYRDITVESSNGLDVEPGKYYFGADGKMYIPEAPFTGIKQAEDGYTYYYVNGAIYKGHPGLIELDGAYYDVKWSGKIAMNEYRDITTENSNGLDVEPGKYYFGEDGKMVL